MKIGWLFVIVPVIGYCGLWAIGIALFLVYFGAFHVPIGSDYTAMILSLPSPLSIATVLIASFVSFFTTARIAVRPKSAFRKGILVGIAIVSFAVTVCLDLLTAVAIERANILLFPVDVMYFGAWIMVIPAVLFGGGQGKPQAPSS